MLLAFVLSCYPTVVGMTSSPPSHTFTFVNSCDETVWVGTFAQNGTPTIGNGGWAMPAKGSKDARPLTISVPVGSSARIWPRTGCEFGADNECGTEGVNCCKTGGCLTSDGKTFGLACAQTGVPPTTLLEWTLDAHSGNGPIDYYDASMVDGWSVPLRMTADTGTYNPSPDPGMDPAFWCAADGCNKAPVCPDAYKVAGSPDSCYSPCMAATLAGSADATKLCCTCSLTDPITCPDAKCAGGYGCTPYHDPPYPADMTCDPWSKDASRAWDPTAQGYIAAVRAACPNVYSWQFDDANATYHCRKTAGLVNYTIEFCP